LNRGPESPSLVLDWRLLREDFLVWLNSRDLCFDYKRSIVGYLDRFSPRLCCSLDVVRLFQGLSPGQKHCLLYSLRNLFNYAELVRFKPTFVNSLRKALPKDSRFVDSYVPTEKRIRQSIANVLAANRERLNAEAVSRACRRYGLVPAKYLRKFVFHKMLELEIPEAVADFIQGRNPATVGRRHYANLKCLADKFDPRYAKYLRKLEG